MPFVHLGAPEIASIRDPARVRSEVRAAGIERGGADGLQCAEWNEVFSALTGVQGPKPVPDCYGQDPKARTPFERWWTWIQTEPRADEGR